ncbi:chromosomal replication initiator dnaA domain protein [Vibrio cholerae HE-45]|nr:chromosomal replication initiator dnaA domain protein [Vibrio cholerae HE-45]
MHQVSLPQAHTAIEEQRVVAMLGVVRHLPGRCPRQLVRLALDEVVEGEGAIEVAGVLETTLDLYGTLGTRCDGRSRRLRRSACHGIEAGARRLLLRGRRHRLANRGSLNLSRSRSGGQRRGGRDTRGGGAFAAY